MPGVGTQLTQSTALRAAVFQIRAGPPAVRCKNQGQLELPCPPRACQTWPRPAGCVQGAWSQFPLTGNPKAPIPGHEASEQLPLGTAEARLSVLNLLPGLHQGRARSAGATDWNQGGHRVSWHVARVSPGPSWVTQGPFPPGQGAGNTWEHCPSLHAQSLSRAAPKMTLC